MRCSTLPLLLLGLAGGGCGGESATDASPSPAQFLRDRASTRFELADFVKPRMDSPATIDPYLAPLLFLEAPHASPIGAALEANAGGLEVDTTSPVVYYADHWVSLDGFERRQLTFVWFRDLQLVRAQGLRVYLGEDGFPEIFEVLADDSGMHLIYVTEALEQRALESHGPPLPDRAFAIEGPESDQLGMVLVKLIANAPSAMGPFVYQAADTNDVTTLLCRCSPMQANGLGQTVEYELMPHELLDGIWTHESDAGFLPPEALAVGLRLPAPP